MTKEIKDGGPAFPTTITIINENGKVCGQIKDSGISVRDYFAAKAMQGLISIGWAKESGLKGVIEVSALSYKFADEMLKAREKTDD